MTEKLLYFSNAKQIDPELAKKCRNCSYRNRGYLCDEFSLARKGSTSGKIVIIIDKATETVLGWGGLFDYQNGFCPEIHVYVRMRCRRKGYGTRIIKKLLSKGKKHEKIQVHQSYYDPNNEFYLKKINDPRLLC